MYAEAMAKVSLDRPMNYQNVPSHRLMEIKDEVYNRINELRLNYHQTVKDDPRKNQLKANFTKCLMNINILKAFKRWKYINQQRLGEQLKAYSDHVKNIFHAKAIESAERTLAAKQNLLTTRKFRHDHIQQEHIEVFNAIDRVKEELMQVKKEYVAVIRQRRREKRAQTAQPKHN